MHFAIAESAHLGSRMPSDFRRFALALAAFTLLPPLLIAAFIIAVDPYFAFGSPSVAGRQRGAAVLRVAIFSAKPYQVRRSGRRRSPSAVPGSRSASIPGIAAGPTHALSISGYRAAPVTRSCWPFCMRRASRGRSSRRWSDSISLASIFYLERRSSKPAREQQQEFARVLRRDCDRAKSSDPLATELAIAAANPAGTKRSSRADPDVAAAIARKRFASGREHSSRSRRPDRRASRRRRDSCRLGRDGYLQVNPDAARRHRPGRLFLERLPALSRGRALQGPGRRVSASRLERGRLPRRQPRARHRNCARALFGPAISTTLPSARPAAWRAAFPPRGPTEWLRLRWPTPGQGAVPGHRHAPPGPLPRGPEASLGTVPRQSMPAPFDDLGRAPVSAARRGAAAAGQGLPRCSAADWPQGAWGPWLAPPRLMYCFTNPRTPA